MHFLHEHEAHFCSKFRTTLEQSQPQQKNQISKLRYLDTQFPKNDVISFSQKDFYALVLRLELG